MWTCGHFEDCVVEIKFNISPGVGYSRKFCKIGCYNNNSYFFNTAEVNCGLCTDLEEEKGFPFPYFFVFLFFSFLLLAQKIKKIVLFSLTISNLNNLLVHGKTGHVKPQHALTMSN
jgi:hypothetical protein